MSKKGVLVSITLVVALLVIAVSGVVTYAQQKTLTVWSVWPEEWIKKIFPVFEKETGIHINWIRESTGQVAARVIASGGHPAASVMFGGPVATFISLKDQGFLQKYVSPAAATIPAADKDPDGYWTGMATDPLCFYSNKSFLKEKGLQPPTSWFDFLLPAYKDSLQFADPRTSGTGYQRIITMITLMHNEDLAFDYLKALKPSVQVYTEHGGGGIIPISTGQAGAGIFFLVDALDAIVNKGYPCVISFPREGITAPIEAIALLKGAPQPELAKKFIDWAVSKQMQQLYTQLKVFFIPTQPGVPVPSVINLKGVYIAPTDTQWFGQHRTELINRWVNQILGGK